METLNLDQFSPKRAEIIALAEQSKLLVINGIGDKIGYQKVHDARIKLQHTRTEIRKTGKAMRAEAVALQKSIIKREDELVELIEPVEQELEAKEQLIDKEKDRQRRMLTLPQRRMKLAAIGLTVHDDELLSMEEGEFVVFFNTSHAAYLAAKEAKIKADEAKVEEEKRAVQAASDAAELEKNRLAEQEAAQIKAEAEAAEKAKQQEIERIQREEQHRLDLEQAKVDAEAKAKADFELQAKQEAEAKERAAAEEAQEIEDERIRTERLTTYKNFLKKNGYTEETKADYFIRKDEGKFILYKKLDEITIK